MSQATPSNLSALEYHVLLAIVEHPLHGYAIRDAIEVESREAVSPRAGSLYRVISRLVSAGYVREADPPSDEPPYPGRERRYYALTDEGREALADEARRLEGSAALALERLGVLP